MKELVEKINAELEAFKNNSNSFVEKSNKAAGARARKNSLELTKLFKEFRKESIKGQIMKELDILAIKLYDDYLNGTLKTEEFSHAFKLLELIFKIRAFN